MKLNKAQWLIVNVENNTIVEQFSHYNLAHNYLLENYVFDNKYAIKMLREYGASGTPTASSSTGTASSGSNSTPSSGTGQPTIANQPNQANQTTASTNKANTSNAVDPAAEKLKQQTEKNSIQNLKQSMNIHGTPQDIETAINKAETNSSMSTKDKEIMATIAKGMDNVTQDPAASRNVASGFKQAANATRLQTNTQGKQ